jgi:hypothetical protein
MDFARLARFNLVGANFIPVANRAGQIKLLNLFMGIDGSRSPSCQDDSDSEVSTDYSVRVSAY